MLALLNQRGVGESFLAQMAQQLQDHRTAENARDSSSGSTASRRTWPRSRPALPAAQAADNLSVSNAITSLRSIGDADWPDIVAATSVLTRAMLTSPAFAAERDDTRDQTLHAIELLARKSGRSEHEVATTLLGLMRGAESAPESGDVDARTVANYWLRGAGRGELRARARPRPTTARSRGQRCAAARRPARLPRRASACATAALVAWMLCAPQRRLRARAPATPWLAALAALLMVFPASEAVVAIVNRLISESARPVRLPRLGLVGGIPPEHRTMVAIPAMLTVAPRAAASSPTTSSCTTSPTRSATRSSRCSPTGPMPTGKATPATPRCSSGAVAEVERLNALYPTPADEPARFIVLHRGAPLLAVGEALDRLGAKARQARAADRPARRRRRRARSSISAAPRRAAPGTRYVVTLDSDTRLPPGRLRELVGVAAHPHNRPQLSADGKRVERGYAILQPHVATPLPEPDKVTLYHWLFAGQPGIDPYSAASSEVYQDVFGEGTYAGKGLLHVQAMHAVLGGRLPENRDPQPRPARRLAGALRGGHRHHRHRGRAVPRRRRRVARAPLDARRLAAAAVPAAHARRWRLRAINRWKMLDNLRRSLVAPMSLALIAFALATGAVSPWASVAARRLRVLGRPADGRARRPGAEPRRHRPRPLLSPGARRPRAAPWPAPRGCSPSCCSSR